MPDSGYIPASTEAKNPSGIDEGTHTFATLFSPLGALCVDRTERFLAIPSRLLRYGQAMTNAWFERRQKCTAANFQAAKRLGECRDGVAFVDLYHRRSTETLIQLVDDVHDGTAGWMGLFQALAVSP